MTEEQTIEYLMGWPVGIEQRDAELRAQDRDLWINDPAARYGFEAEEAVRQWEVARDNLEALYELCMNQQAFNEATAWAFDDARDRADEALRQARRRLKEKKVQ